MRFFLVSCSLWILAAASSVKNPQLEVSTQPPIGSCEPIRDVSLCLGVDWKNASFPNLRQQSTQVEANLELNGYTPLILQGCSNAIVHFLCAVYAPLCVSIPGINIPLTLAPCREVCEYVREGCEPVLIENDFQWPQHLDCDNFPAAEDIDGSIESLCNNINTSEVCIPGQECIKPTETPQTNTSTSTRVPIASQSPTPSVTLTTEDPGRITGDNNTAARVCPPSLFLGKSHTLLNSSYIFGGIDNCAVKCDGVHFTRIERNKVAPSFILICAILCICFTLFTVGTFLIDRQRYHYPERPVIFLALCYLILSFAFVVGSVVKLNQADGSFACSDTKDGQSSEDSFIFQRLPNSSPTYRSTSCVILFIFIYYFQMAASVWWVILTLTWFMASTLKWGEEAVERPWILYHILAWCLPALQVILILALQLVDGDQLSGTCFTGNHHPVAMGVFVLLPLLLYLLIGICFLVIGFMSLVHILQQISQDPHKSRRLTRLIIRILIYGLLYIMPNVIYLCLCIYEIAEREQWETAYAECANNSDCSSPTLTPQFAALLLRYVMLFVIGIFSTFWVISWKTIVAWRKFFSSIFFCRQEQLYVIPAKKETPI